MAWLIALVIGVCAPRAWAQGSRDPAPAGAGAGSAQPEPARAPALDDLPVLEPPPAPATGVIEGDVRGFPSQAPVAGAEVTARSAGGRVYRAQADLHGRFRITGLEAGTYTVEARGLGVTSAPIERRVTAGTTTRVDIELPALEGTAEVIEITVRGDPVAEKLRNSAEAVTVIETEQAGRQTEDLGEVLSRNQGLSVRRSGGLGSAERVSLNGLSDEQVRIFLDGVPLELAGFAAGVANVPVELLERVDVYRGVVPIRFGADALGGAINLVTDPTYRGARASASYQLGSFGTRRLILTGRYGHPGTGLFAGANLFIDSAENDYPIEVEVPDERGRLQPTTVRRFHDAYAARGGMVEVGVARRPWAQRLLLRGFLATYDKELQHNMVMTVPYGEAHHSRSVTGAMLRYESPLHRDIHIDAVAGYTYRVTHFLDQAEDVYDWFGQKVRERPQPGEIGSSADDQVIWEHKSHMRMNMEWAPGSGHALRLSLSPTYATRSGQERYRMDAQTRDPLSAQRDLLTLVTGLEYQVDVLDQALENVLFVKDYVLHAAYEEVVQDDVFRQLDELTHQVGVGNALRFRVTEGLLVKASYEYATRLPTTDELFGDGVLILPNLELVPEISHNANLGVAFRKHVARLGAVRSELNGFARFADQLITLLGNDQTRTYQNLFRAHSIGVEAVLGWTSPGGTLALDGNFSWQDLRNTSPEGAFGEFAGDRVPHRPWLFANGSARVRLPDVSDLDDEVTLTWRSRYVHEFFRSWESAGRLDSKQQVPSQLTHTAGLSYRLRHSDLAITATAEVHNLTDARTFDFFGVQRPGRALFAKLIVEH